MADQAVISISTGVWEKKLKAYMLLTGKNIQAVLAEEWPLLIRKIIDFTPPYKTRANAAAGTFASSASDLSVGRKATSRDIYKTMRPFDPQAIRTKGLQAIVDRKDITAFNIVASRSHNAYMMGATAVAFDKTLHTSARDERGRVMGRDRNCVVLGSDAKLLKQYVAHKQANVGLAKAGWAPAYNLVRGDGPALPAYVGRQTAYGAVIDDRANETHPSITAINRTPWSVRQDEGARIRADAYASRVNAIISKTKTYLKLASKDAGFRAPGVAAA